MKKLFLFITLVLALCFTFDCQQGEEVAEKMKPRILVVPGDSIAGVKLDMNYNRVISILGNPLEIISSNDIKKIGGEYRILGGEKHEGEIPRMKILHYKSPPLVIVLNEKNKVNSLQLAYTENVKVKGYGNLKFRYLSKKELKNLGKPTSKTRDRQAEKQLMSKAPNDSIIEYNVYNYREKGIRLGLIFDKKREMESIYFIALNYIAVIEKE